MIILNIRKKINIDYIEIYNNIAIIFLINKDDEIN